jgi:hypothetical protein
MFGTLFQIKPQKMQLDSIFETLKQTMAQAI